MANITRKVLEDEISILNSTWHINLNLRNKNSIYVLYNDKNDIFYGSAKEVYIYLSGLRCGLSGKFTSVKKEEKNFSTEYTGLNFLKDKEGSTVIIEGTKVATNTYFSQNKIIYRVDIAKCNHGMIYFTADVQVVTSDNTPINGSIYIEMQSVQLYEHFSINECAETIVRMIDAEVRRITIEKAHTRKPIDSDLILWIKPEELRAFGWSNSGLITKSAKVKVIK